MSRNARDRLARGLVAAALLLLGATPAAPASEPGPKTASPLGTRRVLIVCGLPGDDGRRAVYAGAVEAIENALVDRHGFDRREVRVRFGAGSREGDGPALKSGRGPATAADIAADVDEVRKASTADDALWVIVLGHSQFDGRRSYLNLPGPDLSDAAFAALFAGVKAREQVFFITTSASGYFIQPLSAPGRVVISATEADQEVNETLFPLALATVLAAPPADHDRDRDGALSVFELYLAAVADVMARYNADKLIPTEHAQLDDNGDGHGSEVQLRFLPAGSGGQVGEEKGKVREQEPEGPRKVEPKLGPKDDGFVASRTRVDGKPRPGGNPR